MKGGEVSAAPQERDGGGAGEEEGRKRKEGNVHPEVVDRHLEEDEVRVGIDVLVLSGK